MKPLQIPSKSIEDYIAKFPPDVRRILEQLRQTIRKAVPEATEAIKYGMPTFVFEGNLVFFAAWKNHIGFYPRIKEFENELAGYDGDKGSIQFPFDQPIPYNLIRRMAKFRAKENLAKAKQKVVRRTKV